MLADTDTELEVDWLSNMEVLNDADFLADSLNDCDTDWLTTLDALADADLLNEAAKLCERTELSDWLNDMLCDCFALKD